MESREHGKQAEEIFKAEFLKASGKEADATIMHHMRYAIDAMESYASLRVSEAVEANKKPFLGWTNDKDILNQQREYWGAMNGIKELREAKDKEIAELKERIEHLEYGENI